MREDLTPEKMSKFAKKFKDARPQYWAVVETRPSHINEMAKLIS